MVWDASVRNELDALEYVTTFQRDAFGDATDATAVTRFAVYDHEFGTGGSSQEHMAQIVAELLATEKPDGYKGTTVEGLRAGS